MKSSINNRYYLEEYCASATQGVDCRLIEYSINLYYITGIKLASIQGICCSPSFYNMPSVHLIRHRERAVYPFYSTLERNEFHKLQKPWLYIGQDFLPHHRSHLEFAARVNHRLRYVSGYGINERIPMKVGMDDALCSLTVVHCKRACDESVYDVAI